MTLCVAFSTVESKIRAQSNNTSYELSALWQLNQHPKFDKEVEGRSLHLQHAWYFVLLPLSIFYMRYGIFF